MAFTQSVKILFVLLFVGGVSLPYGYAELVYNRPPVEKTTAKKKKRPKRASKLKQQSPNKDQKVALSREAMIAINTVAYYILFIGAVLLFIFGAFLGFLWILGLCLMVASYVYAFVLLYLFDGLFGCLWVFIGLVFGNLLLGITFLIYGLIVSLPLFWILGIILICLAFVFWVVATFMSPI